MKEEVDQLLLSLQRLLDSCADHDILYDIFVSPADPAGYREAQDYIARIIAMIRQSGITREEISRIVSEAGFHRVPALEGIVTLHDLVPLLGTGFSPEQEDQIRDSCHRWAEALDPCHARDIEGVLRSAVRSLDLADLLAPEVTRMLRFPAILRIQETAGRIAQKNGADAGGQNPEEECGAGSRGRRGSFSQDNVNAEEEAAGPGEVPSSVTGYQSSHLHWEKERIVVTPFEDPARFSGHLYQDIFLFLVRNNHVPEPLFPGPVYQALFDLGVRRAQEPAYLILSREDKDSVGDYEGHSRVFRGDGPLVEQLTNEGKVPPGEGGRFSRVYRQDTPIVELLVGEGTSLAGEPGTLDDIRTLYRIAIESSRSHENSGSCSERMDRRTSSGDRGNDPRTSAGYLCPDKTISHMAGITPCRDHQVPDTLGIRPGGEKGDDNVVSSSLLDSYAGHVLAGWAIARENLSRRKLHREQEATDTGDVMEQGAGDGDPAGSRSAIGHVLSFVRSVAGRPAGRAVPGQERIRALDQTVREMEQLLRAVTGDYTWKAVAYPHPAEGFRPVVDLWPDRHILLFDREELAFREGDSSRALLMEAYYRYRFGPDPGEDDPWFARLALVTGTSRAVKAGTACHPGVARWMETLAGEEADPAHRRAGQVLAGGFSLPDQFLAGALYESRTCSRADIVADAKVLEALDSTRASRQAANESGLTGEEFSSILREHIWPVFERLLHEPTPFTGPGAGELSGARPGGPGTRGISPGKSRGGSTLTTRGSAPRVDTSVPHSTFPTADTPGRAIEGEGGGLMDDDGFQVAGTGSGRSAGHGESWPGKAPAGCGRGGAPGGPIPEEGGGSPGSPVPWSPDRQSSPGGGNAQSGDSLPSGSDAGAPETPGPGPGIRETVEDLVQACSRGLDLLRDQTSRESPMQGDKPGDMGETEQQEDSRRPGNDTSPGVGLETGPGPLHDLAREIDDLTNSLGAQLRELRDAHPGKEETGPSGPAMGRPPGMGQEMDDLLKTSERVFRAAGEFRKAVNDLEREIRESGSGPGASRIRTGMTRKTLMDLQEAGVEFQRMTGASFRSGPGERRPLVRVPDEPEEPAPAQPPRSARTGPVAPAFMADAVDSAEVWESLSYFDASYGDDEEQAEESASTGLYTRGTAEQRYVQGEQALTHEAARYLSALQHRTRSEWESIEEKAERIRQIALFETNEVGEDDFAMYQRFYQPVAGLVGVARKNIQQALQKNRATRDLTELSSGDDIDEENLAAVRTTMRIFRDSGKQEDRATWCLSLLLDASSSMHDETVAKKLEATIRTAILFGEALNRVQGITFEIAAFSDTEYIPLKRYQDDWNIHQGCYLIRQLIRASGGTNDVGAVGSALDRMNRLRMAAGANKMIFIISDGQSGVGGREQMRKILARHKEVRIFGWGIGPDMEKIEETYRPYGTHVREIADLPRSLGEVLRRELGRPAMAGWKEEGPGTAAGESMPGEKVCTD